MGKVLTEAETVQEVEQSKVVEWRFKWLSASGFSRRNAQLLATSQSVDLWFACRAIQNAKAKGFDEDYVIKLIL